MLLLTFASWTHIPQKCIKYLHGFQCYLKVEKFTMQDQYIYLYFKGYLYLHTQMLYA